MILLETTKKEFLKGLESFGYHDFLINKVFKGKLYVEVVVIHDICRAFENKDSWSKVYYDNWLVTVQGKKVKIEYMEDVEDEEI